VIKILLTPGLWLQALTTREPDDAQLVVGITAMKAAIAADEEVAQVMPAVVPPVVGQ
jgi:uncharacterized protein YqhQ